MNVEELIEELKEYNPKAEVSLTTHETIFVSYICDGEDVDKLNTRHVFIEGCDYDVG